MENKRWGRILILAGLALAVTGTFLAWRAMVAPRAPAGAVPETRAATVLKDDKPLPPFDFGKAGGRFTNRDLEGRWTFLFFGYTQCPDICPTALALMARVKAGIVERKGQVPQVAFVSVDPKRDTPALLAQYVPHFDPSFVGAVGDDAALGPLVKHLGVFYVRHDKGDDAHYAVDHTAAIYLIDPKGRLLAVFSAPQDAGRVIEDYLVLSAGETSVR